MAFTQPTAPFLEWQIFYATPTSQCLNRFFFDVSDGISAAQLKTWADAVVASQGDKFLDILSSSTEIVTWKFRCRTTLELLEYEVAGGQQGHDDPDPLPSQNVAIITWHVGQDTGGTRIARGRSGISGIAESESDSGIMSATIVGTIRTFAQSLSTTPSLNGSVPVFCIWRPTYSTKAPVLSASISNLFKANLHRRILS